MAEERAFVSRAGTKLEHALEAFSLEVNGFHCVDFGCNVGGFTDCLLSRGAREVVAIDTGYGTLAWTLRNDDRVVVRERTNALHAEPDAEVDLVVIDLAWTPQALALPAAQKWLAPGGKILTLVKPHYELKGEQKSLLSRGFLPAEHAASVFDQVVESMREMGFIVEQTTQSPLRGGKTARKRGVPGNIEFLALLSVVKNDTDEATFR